ncbi:hypothetical protein PV325_008888 [Microctonus aethiopoides]|nr:hypothetical protein PV325_008888 [Microctonus aethiopoides]
MSFNNNKKQRKMTKYQQPVKEPEKNVPACSEAQWPEACKIMQKLFEVQREVIALLRNQLQQQPQQQQRQQQLPLPQPEPQQQQQQLLPKPQQRQQQLQPQQQEWLRLWEEVNELQRQPLQQELLRLRE